MTPQIGNVEIGPHGLRQDPDAGCLKVGLRRQSFRPGSTRGVAVAAPEIDFVGEIPADRVSGQPQPIREDDAEGGIGLVVQSQFLQLRADAGVGLGQDGGLGDFEQPLHFVDLAPVGHEQDDVIVGLDHRVVMGHQYVLAANDRADRGSPG